MLSHDELQNYALKNLCRNKPREKEIGPYREQMRFDCISVNRNKRSIRIFEVKANREDFERDDKWQKYLEFCTHFAFVCNRSLIEKDELPKNVGLVYVWKENDVLKHKYIRGCREIRPEIDEENYLKIIEQIATRHSCNAEKVKVDQRSYKYFIRTVKRMSEKVNDTKETFKSHQLRELARQMKNMAQNLN